MRTARRGVLAPRPPGPFRGGAEARRSRPEGGGLHDREQGLRRSRARHPDFVRGDGEGAPGGAGRAGHDVERRDEARARRPLDAPPSPRSRRRPRGRRSRRCSSASLRPRSRRSRTRTCSSSSRPLGQAQRRRERGAARRRQARAGEPRRPRARRAPRHEALPRVLERRVRGRDACGRDLSQGIRRPRQGEVGPRRREGSGAPVAARSAAGVRPRPGRHLLRARHERLRGAGHAQGQEARDARQGRVHRAARGHARRVLRRGGSDSIRRTGRSTRRSTRARSSRSGRRPKARRPRSSRGSAQQACVRRLARDARWPTPPRAARASRPRPNGARPREGATARRTRGATRGSPSSATTSTTR